MLSVVPLIWVEIGGLEAKYCSQVLLSPNFKAQTIVPRKRMANYDYPTTLRHLKSSKTTHIHDKNVYLPKNISICSKFTVFYPEMELKCYNQFKIKDQKRLEDSPINLASPFS